MSDIPLISVIVPVYNGERYMAECIECVLSQTYHNLELIIVDDGSTDDTGRITRQFAAGDKRIKLIRQSNLGPSSARNTGLENARGSYLTFIDADDVISQDYLEILYILLCETDAEIAACTFTRKYHKLGLYNENYVTLDSRGYVADVLYQRLSDNSICGKLFNASLWENVRFRDMRYEDLEVFPRVCLKSKSVTFTEARLYFYRTNVDSFINTFSPERFDSTKAADLILHHITEAKCDARLIGAARSRKLAANFNVFLLAYGNPRYIQEASQAWDTIKSLRIQCLKDSNVSSKIKIGIVVSLAGPTILKLFNAIFKISK